VLRRFGRDHCRLAMAKIAPIPMIATMTMTIHVTPLWSAAANLNRQAARDLAIYFSSLRPQAANDGNEEFVGLGRRIYQEGMPDSNIVACIACHGPAAQGVREIPRLGGLEYAYVQRRLEQWQEGYDRSARHPMPHVASKLSLNQIAALASYLSFMKE
jgi:cytochrome c553